jgi:hypothetical protein
MGETPIEPISAPQPEENTTPPTPQTNPSAAAASRVSGQKPSRRVPAQPETTPQGFPTSAEPRGDFEFAPGAAAERTIVSFP